MGLKIIAGLFIVFLSTIFGVNFSRKYGRKKEYFTALENFCNYLKREISFSVTPVGTAVKNFVSDNEDLLFTLSSCAFSGEIRSGCFPSYLSEDEKKFVSSFFSKLGMSDKKNELELIASFSEELGKYRETEKNKCAKITGLSAKLGFFAGAVIFVILL